MHEQQKSVTFRETVSMTDLFPSAQYLEVEGAVGNGVGLEMLITHIISCKDICRCCC